MKESTEREVRSMILSESNRVRMEFLEMVRDLTNVQTKSQRRFEKNLNRLIKAITRTWTPPIDLQELRQVVAMKQPVYMLNAQGVPALQVTNVDALKDFSVWMDHELTGQYICSSKDEVTIEGPSENPDAGFLNESFGGTD